MDNPDLFVKTSPSGARPFLLHAPGISPVKKSLISALFCFLLVSLYKEVPPALCILNKSLNIDKTDVLCYNTDKLQSGMNRGEQV